MSLPYNISNRLVRRLRHISKLNNDTIKLLTKEHFTITEADISDCNIDVSSLSVLLSHSLDKLSTAIYYNHVPWNGTKPSFTINSTSITYWDLTDLYYITNADLLESIKLLPNLRTLIASKTKIDDLVLENITQINSELEHIDLSFCKTITDISPIRRLTKLKVLSLRALNINMNDVEEVFRKLSLLEVLDISFTTDSNLSLVLFKILVTGDDCFWPNLRSLDLSQNSLETLNELDIDMFLAAIIAKHPQLTMLYICGSAFDGRNFSNKIPSNLTILNGSNLVSSCIENLAECSEISHAIRALHNLRNILIHHDMFERKQIIDCYRLCIQTMIKYPKSFDVQILATYFCLEFRPSHLHYLDTNLLSLLVDRCIYAVERNHDLRWILTTLHSLEEDIPTEIIDWRRIIILEINILENTSNFEQIRRVVAESKLLSVFMDKLRQFSKDSEAFEICSSAIFYIIKTFINLSEKCFFVRSYLVHNGIIPIVFDIIIISSADCRCLYTRDCAQLLIFTLARDEFERISIESRHLEIFSGIETMDSKDRSILLESLAHLLASRAPCESIQRSKDRLRQILVLERMNHTNLNRSRRHSRDLRRDVMQDIRFRFLVRLISRFDAPGSQLFAISIIRKLCDYETMDYVEYIDILRDERGLVALEDIVNPSSTASEELRKIAIELLNVVQ